jgi:beta-lactamase class A
VTAALAACALCLSTFGAWKPDVPAAKRYAAQRPTTVSFAVRTNGRFFGYQTTRAVPSASTVKAMLMVAYLREPSVRSRPLRRADRRLLSPMIRWSDNAAASTVRNVVGNEGLARVARRAHMLRFRTAPSWGSSIVDANDQTKLWLRIDRLIPRRHRAYGMWLLSHVIRSQQWGIARAVPRGWKLYFKSGWGSGSGAVDHQVALLERGGRRVAVAIMTTGNPSHASGAATLRGVARRLLRGLTAVKV